VENSIDFSIKRSMPYRNVYEQKRKDKDGFTETIWSFDRFVKGWRFTGRIESTRM